MKFKWRHCSMYRDEINLYRDVGDVGEGMLGWVCPAGDESGYVLYMQTRDCPSEVAGTVYPTALQAMRALRREYLTMLIAGEFNDD